MTITALLSRYVPIPAALIRRGQPADPQVLADRRANRAYWWREAGRIGASEMPPFELRTEDWPVQCREELKTLADLTDKHKDPWLAASKMKWGSE